jgi:hypothetical protein
MTHPEGTGMVSDSGSCGPGGIGLCEICDVCESTSFVRGGQNPFDIKLQGYWLNSRGGCFSGPVTLPPRTLKDQYGVAIHIAQWGDPGTMEHWVRC